MVLPTREQLWELSRGAEGVVGRSPVQGTIPGWTLIDARWALVAWPGEHAAFESLEDHQPSKAWLEVPFGRGLWLSRNDLRAFAAAHSKTWVNVFGLSFQADLVAWVLEQAPVRLHASFPLITAPVRLDTLDPVFGGVVRGPRREVTTRMLRFWSPGWQALVLPGWSEVPWKWWRERPTFNTKLEACTGICQQKEPPNA